MQNKFESSISESGTSSPDDDFAENSDSSQKVISCEASDKFDEDLNRDVSITSQSKPKTYAKVVIIGAGLAGLAAAQRLWSLGIKDIVLLEAQNYVGGRVKTIKHSSGILELVSV